MRVILRLKHGPVVGKKRRKNQQVALAFSALLTPAAVMAFALGLWRIGNDVALTGPFAITEGLFSHWQVWFTLALVLQASALGLMRYGSASEEGPAPGSAKQIAPR